MLPTLADYMESLRNDTTEMASVAAGNMDRRIPGCPDWNMKRLVQHAGEVLYFWTEIAEHQLQSYKDVERATIPDDENHLLPWFHEVAEHAIAVLSASVPTEHVWTWAPNKDVGFIQRRMPQELSVHTWDARSAVSEDPRPIDPLMAHDGINEFFDTFCRGYDERKGPDISGSLHLHQTDGEGEWLVHYSPHGIEFGHEHAEADSAVRGSASDLLLMLWRRVPTDSEKLEVFGDEEKLNSFVGWLDLS